MQADILGLIDDTHSAAAKPFQDAVVRDGLPDEGVGYRHGGHLRFLSGVSQSIAIGYCSQRYIPVSLEFAVTARPPKGLFCGIFCRGDSFAALPKCIRQVHNGQIWVNNGELEFLLELVIFVRPLKIQQTGGMARLTPRERDVVRLVADGMRNQAIAFKLNLSEHTIRNYLIRIFDKLGISSRVELVLYAFSGTEGNAAPENSKAFFASA